MFRSFLASLAATLVAATSLHAAPCMQDAWQLAGNGQSLTCKANDVRIGRAIPGTIRDLQGADLAQCVAGSTFSFVADFEVVLTAQTRFDVGLYFATDGDQNGSGDGALTGTCDVSVIEPKDPAPPGLGSATFVNLDPAPDTCGDIDRAHNPQIVTVRVDNVLCQDSDGDGFLNLPNCTSWRQDGANEVCDASSDAFPGAPSKCNCDPGFEVPILVEVGSIGVTKDADPLTRPEPGGTFTYTVTVENGGDFTGVTIERICDDRHGTIANATATPCPAGTLGAITGTTCVVPATLPPGGEPFSCTFTTEILSDVPVTVTNTVAVSGVDQNAKPVAETATAQIMITDVAPTAQVVKSLDGLRCAVVRYDLEVRNTSSVESLTLTELADDGFGDVTTIQGAVEATTCSVPQTIPALDKYECTFDARFCGGTHTNTVSASVVDDEQTTIREDSNTLEIEVDATTK